MINDCCVWLSSVTSPCETKEELVNKVEDVRSWVTEEINEFAHAVINNDKREQLNAVVDAIWILSNLAFFAGLKIEDINKEAELVKLSNFSKFCKSEQEAIDTVNMYKEGTHPNKLGIKWFTYYKPTGNPEYPFAIFKVSDDKILKSINFVDTNQL